MNDETMPPLPIPPDRAGLLQQHYSKKQMHAYARAYAEQVVADERRRRQEAEMMADCTALLRDDLIEMGLIDKSCAPMFLTQGICAAIRREVAKEREACALDIEHEASLWRGEEDISNFRLSAARVRSRGTQA